MGLELYLIGALIAELGKNQITLKIVVLLISEMIFITVFLLCGIIISVSDRELSDTFLYFPFVMGAVPSFVFIYGASFLMKYETDSTL